MSDTTIYGYSLLLDDGDLVIEDGKLRIVEGQDNLIQALTLRVLTPYGTDLFNTSYGLDVSQAFTQPNGLRMLKELIKLHLVRTLGTDPRISDIREIIFDDEPTYLARHPDLDPQRLRDQHHRRIWQVDIVLDTIQSQSTILSLTIGV